MIKKLNMPAFIILVPYPILLVMLTVAYCFNVGAGWKEFTIAALGYYCCNIAIGVGMHRLWAHSSYKAKDWFHALLAFFSAGCLQGPSLVWASDHRFHHAYADKDLDPHTPLKFKNKWKGLFWAHMGWMLVKEPKKSQIDKLTLRTLGKNKALRWQMRYYWQLATFMNIVPPILLGFIIFAEFSLKAGIAGFLFVGIGRAVQQHMTFAVNSLCHFVGNKKYANDSSHDIWWLAPLLLGENWHNFHHAFGKDYRNGHKAYHLDIHKWIIWCMSKVGIASDLVITSAERIQAKEEEIRGVAWKNDVLSVENRAKMIYSLASEKLSGLQEAFNRFSSKQKSRLTTSNESSSFAPEIALEQEKQKDGLENHLLSSVESIKYKGVALAKRLDSAHSGLYNKETSKLLSKVQARMTKVLEQAQSLSNRAEDFVNSCEFSHNVTSRAVSKFLRTMEKLEASANKLGIIADTNS